MSQKRDMGHPICGESDLGHPPKTVVVQPIKEEQTDQTVASAVSSKFHFQGLVSEFAFDAVNEARGQTGEGEFVVTVIGANQKKDFKVKAKHFSKL